MGPQGLARAALLGLLLAAAGCNRNTEPYVPLDQEPPAPARPVRIPDLAQSRIDPSRLAAPLAGPSMPSGAPGSPQTAPPAGAAAADAAGKVIRGTVRLADGARAPDQGVLFVTLRKPQLRPPIAALRLQVGSFPMPFEIGPDDAIAMGGASVPFEGPLELSARIDIDGNALTRSPGDLASNTVQVEPGASGVEIVLGGE